MLKQKETVKVSHNSWVNIHYVLVAPYWLVKRLRSAVVLVLTLQCEKSICKDNVAVSGVLGEVRRKSAINPVDLFAYFSFKCDVFNDAFCLKVNGQGHWLSWEGVCLGVRLWRYYYIIKKSHGDIFMAAMFTGVGFKRISQPVSPHSFYRLPLFRIPFMTFQPDCLARLPRR